MSVLVHGRAFEELRWSPVLVCGRGKEEGEGGGARDTLSE